MLGWIDTEDDLLFSLQNRLQFGVRTNAAIMRHQHGEPRDGRRVHDARSRSHRSLGLYQEGFITDPLWHTSFPHYWHGTTLIEARLPSCRGENATFLWSSMAGPRRPARCVS